MFAVPKIAIDLGTANSIVMLEGKGIVLQQPTVVALDTKKKRILATGDDAKQMLNKVPDGIIACRPLSSGRITHYKATAALLSRFLRETLPRYNVFRPEVMVSVPAGLSSMEERSVVRALMAAGAGQVYLLPEPIAAALGAGLPIHTSAGNMIVNLGGGTVEVAIISMNGTLAVDSIQGAGDALNQSIVDYVQHKYNLEISLGLAEEVKFSIGNVFVEDNTADTIIISGRNTELGMMQEIELKSKELEDILRKVLTKTIDSVRKVIAEAPPELSDDIAERGIVLSGGTAQLQGLDKFLAMALNVPVYVAEEPLLCVTKGLSKAINRLDDFGKVMRK